MLKRVCVAVLAAAAVLGVSAKVWAAPMKSYQVTGPVVEVTDAKIVVETKDDGKWDIALDKDTKVTGDVKVGTKVTVKYRMTATSVEVKGDAAKEEGKDAAKAPAGK